MKRQERQEKQSKISKNLNLCGRNCKICDVHLLTEESYQEHLQSPCHLKNQVARKPLECKTYSISLYALSDYQRDLHSKRHRQNQSFCHHIVLIIVLSSLLVCHFATRVCCVLGPCSRTTTKANCKPSKSTGGSQ